MRTLTKEGIKWTSGSEIRLDSFENDVACVFQEGFARHGDVYGPGVGAVELSETGGINENSLENGFMGFVYLPTSDSHYSDFAGDGILSSGRGGLR